MSYIFESPRIQALLEEMRARPRPPVVECAEVVPGQIRRVGPPAGVEAESRLCVVLDTELEEGHAMVAIAWSGDSWPSTRDVLLPRAATGAAFDLHASVDHVVTVGLDQLGDPRIQGTAGDAAVELLATGCFFADDDELGSETGKAGLETGLLQVQWGDQLWAHRIREARNTRKLFPY